jgi:ribonuclease Z
MDCILMGTGGMMPMPFRLLTSLMVRTSGRNYMFDAGEGTQIGLKQAKPGLRAMRMIAITHLHADHCLGLPGILMLRAQMEQPEPLTIVGPPGISRFVQSVRDSIDFYVNYPIDFVEWTDTAGTIAWADEFVTLFWAPMKHSIFCLGYRLEEKSRPGKFNIRAAQELNIPEGPLWGRLQRGETIQLANGKRIKPEQVLGPTRPGRVVSFIVDTRPNKSVTELCGNADLTFIEGMFLNELQTEAEDKGHLTAHEAAFLTKSAQSKRVVLVHFSPRYQNSDLLLLQEEAQKVNENVQIGRSGIKYQVPLPEESADT